VAEVSKPEASKPQAAPNPEPKKEEPAAAEQPNDELLCTFCGLKACWTK